LRIKNQSLPAGFTGRKDFLMDANTTRIHDQLDTIQNRYDPENDLASPRVSWTEYELSLMVRSLALIVVKLEGRIETLENGGNFER